MLFGSQVQHESSMKAARLSLFIFLLSFTEQTTAQHDACPSWFIFQAHNGSSITCHCIYSSLTGVKCFPILQFGFCVTYNSSTEIVELGPCPYVSRYNTTSTTIIDYKVFYILPDNASLLNKFMCGPLNREGHCVGSVKISMLLHYTLTLWNAVSAGDMVMDGPCTIFWNSSQQL